MPFENLLQLAADNEKETLSQFVNKNPQVRALFDLGERVQTTIRPKLKAMGYQEDVDLEVPMGNLETLERWRQSEWPTWQRIHDVTKTALDTAQAKITELEARTNTDMTPEEIRVVVKEALAEAGVVDNKALETALNKQLTEQIRPEMAQNSNGLANRFQQVYSALTPKVIEHEKNFGEILNPADVFAHMEAMAKEQGVSIAAIDPIKAYNDMVAPKQLEKQKTMTAADIEKARKEGIEAGKKEALAQMSSGPRSVPVDGAGGTARMGVVQRRQMEKLRESAGADGSIKAPLGKGILSRMAADKHRETELASSVA